MNKKLLVSLISLGLFIFMAATFRDYEHYYAVIIISLFLLVATIPTYRYLEHQKIAKLHKAETLANGAEDEPRIVRSLTPEEELILKDKIRQSQHLYDSLWLIIIVAGTIDAAFVWFVIEYQAFAASFQIIGAFIFAQVALVLKVLQSQNLYLDLRSPVFRVAGYAIKEKQQSKQGTHYYLYVRTIKFSEQDFPQLEKVFDEIRDKGKIEVEYSPRTKYVWSWKKLN